MGPYIAQGSCSLVGVAARVMVAIPFHLHHYQSYGKIVIIGEFMAV